MAKGKSTNAGKPQPASRSKRSASPSQASRQAASEKQATPGAPQEFSGIQIGHVAGEVWGLLNSDGAQTLAAIKKSVDAPSDVVMAAIGWLAREEKLDYTTSGRMLKISLR